MDIFATSREKGRCSSLFNLQVHFSNRRLQEAGDGRRIARLPRPDRGRGSRRMEDGGRDGALASGAWAGGSPAPGWLPSDRRRCLESERGHGGGGHGHPLVILVILVIGAR